MAVRVCNKVVIEGGGLREPWVPRDIVTSAGKQFIDISKNDSKLALFVRPPIFNKGQRPFLENPFFDDLRRLRNDAVDQLIWNRLKQDDPLLQDSSMDKVINKHRKSIDESELPEYVTIHLPCIDYTPADGSCPAFKCDGIAINCLLTTQRVRTVCVECVPDQLQYVRYAILQAAFDNGEQRDKRPRSFTGVHGVMCDKRRKTVYAMVKADTPAGKRRVQKKPSEWSATFISQSAREPRE